MASIKCLIVDDVDTALFQLLDKAAIAYDYKPDWSKETCIEALPAYEGLVIRSKFRVDKKIIDSCTKLQFIARAGAGVDNIDKEYLKEKNIALFHASEGNRVAVGEHTLGLILALINNIVRSDTEVKDAIWLREENRGYELESLTVGLIGYGNMGKETSKRLAAFGCKIIAYDKYRENYSCKNAEQVDIEKLKAEADIISLHIPLDDFSRGWVDKTFFDSVAKPFWLINTARGEIVKLKDLNEALQSGKVRGAALDVLENEKLSTLTTEQRQDFDLLVKNPNVILTPHIAGWTFESYRKISEVLGEKILFWYLNK
ncbi:2-hydroxyacid dehydrogenase [Cytophaga hutchinsonii]|uniref:Phosphoglycerate dehydrogenase n=1 Tax=Cytophaga hutchinsonii (strain ATCC 33406 / DSM 1761 / CIP 103989 / NBRC 15051 / NCIMB 9469 / D465) TaxID=269798 RepID=A0A6N4SRJ3_CYTH3|nr:2-hydroxyacid dehydrogenase [Cytophaga hutchinsonii]ABG58899.1 phosphoglycerate dehydrogenase [Cytophaga hutchinsonii ATCC 33406]SFX81645.1 D-3-phosphoglycerate dehydrogenase [Cytophaga hutchinsonii ATCC 33406]